MELPKIDELSEDSKLCQENENSELFEDCKSCKDAEDSDSCDDGDSCDDCESCGETHHLYVCSYCGAPEMSARPHQYCTGCQLVSYCSKDCQKDDRKAHKPICKEFPVVNGINALKITGSSEEYLANCRDRLDKLSEHNMYSQIFGFAKVCYTCGETHPGRLKICKCACAVYCSKACSHADNLHTSSECKELCEFAESIYQQKMKESYVTSFWYALKHMDEVVGDICKPEGLKMLKIHIVINITYFNVGEWEYLFHQIPSLQKLHLDFVIQNTKFDPKFKVSARVNLTDCDDCKAKNCYITFAVHQKPYHMFFSSLEYTEPDFVVAYGIPYANNDIHSEMSYCNMTYHQQTVLVLMDSTKDKVAKGIQAVNAARPINVLVPTMRNPLRGFGSLVAQFNYDATATNVKYYFTCLIRKFM